MAPWCLTIMMVVERRQSTFLVHSKFIMLREQYLGQAVSLVSLQHQSKEALKEIEYAILCIPSSLVEGNHLVKFEGELWLGQLIKLAKSGTMVRCLKKAVVVGSIWRWPEKPNEKEYVLEDIRQEIQTPLNCGSKTSSLRSSNLLVHVPELEYMYK